MWVDDVGVCGDACVALIMYTTIQIHTHTHLVLAHPVCPYTPKHTQVYKQKVKHLLYEHKHNVASLKADAEGAVHTAVQAAASKQEAVMQDVHKLQAMLRDKVARLGCVAHDCVYCP